MKRDRPTRPSRPPLTPDAMRAKGRRASSNIQILAAAFSTVLALIAYYQPDLTRSREALLLALVFVQGSALARAVLARYPSGGARRAWVFGVAVVYVLALASVWWSIPVVHGEPLFLAPASVAAIFFLALIWQDDWEVFASKEKEEPVG